MHRQKYKKAKLQTPQPSSIQPANKVQQAVQKMLSRCYNELSQQLNLKIRGVDLNDLHYILAQNWSTLQILNLHGNQLCSQSVRMLALGNWPELKVLDLGRNKLGAEALRGLAVGVWPKLRVLRLSKCLDDNRIGDKGMLSLAKLSLPALKQLNVAHTGLTPQAVPYLQALFLKNLEHLELKDYNMFSVCSVFELAGVVGHWPCLQILQLEIWALWGFTGPIGQVFNQIVPQLCTLYLRE